MPELPEVETVRRGLEQKTLGREIVGGDVLLEGTIAYPISVAEFLAGLKGAAIARWHRRGKYLLAELFDPKNNTPGGWLGIHLRMTGQLLWLDEGEPLQKHTRARLFLQNNSTNNLKNNSSKGDRSQIQELRFVDIRTFGKLWWVPPEAEISSIITGLKKLGPEPFSPEFSVEYLAKQLHKRQRAIKTALLDQGLVAGLGNIYADEVLFVSGIRPTSICKELTPQQIEALHPAIIEVLQKAIDAGGTTFSNFINLLGINGNYGGVAWVYKRGGQPCRVCDTLIERIKLGGRSTHYCPSCQAID
ncbi:MAG: DNA-formamidopyrimidine glycosylase [Cyanobacteriota bacterium]|nr:DNA-formamidopyrimidine glycosylase [Cyanobacteriota bacterium]